MKKVLSAAITALILVGCQEAPQPAITTMQEIPESANTGRFLVTRETLFYDDIAYKRKRGIYIITDTETGKEYIGISGIGISEIGTHRSGKATHTDER